MSRRFLARPTRQFFASIKRTRSGERNSSSHARCLQAKASCETPKDIIEFLLEKIEGNGGSWQQWN